VVLSDPGGLGRVGRVILPGVGNFRHGMEQLRQRGFEQVLREEVVAQQIPLLGICLGMQYLSTRSWESGETKGLGLIPGEVKRFQPADPSVRVPHVGWNEVRFTTPSPLFEGVPDGSDFYFVHSYHFTDVAPGDTAARTEYAGGFVSAVAHDLVFGVQFHPEKSQKLGFKVLQNFLSL
jgi:glutamine amidotransferase